MFPRTFRRPAPACDLMKRRWFTAPKCANEAADLSLPDCVEEVEYTTPKKPMDVSSIDKSLFTKRIEITMPELDMGKGKVVKWYKKPGEFVQCEDVICDVEMQRVPIGLQMDDDEDLGVMGEIIVPAGDEEVEENGLIATIFHRQDAPDNTESKASETEQRKQIPKEA